MQLKKNSVYTITINAYSSDGDGIGRLDGLAVFVKGALVGEVCDIKITKVSKNCAWARLLKVVEASAQRIKSDCKYSKRCGGCRLRHMAYAEELKFKEQKINNAFWKIAKQDLRVDKVYAGDYKNSSIYNYRNKAVFPVAKAKDGKVNIGLYQNRSHDIIDIDTCKIQSKICDKIIKTIRDWMTKFDIEAYDETTGSGLIRHIYIRTNYKDEALLCIVTNAKDIPHIKDLKHLVQINCPEVVGLVQNINDKKVNVIRGTKFVCLDGSDVINDKLCDFSFDIDAASFFQVNRLQAEVLYKQAIELSGVAKNDTVLDLYCGTGTITLLFAKYARRVIGVEIVQDAIKNAQKNAEQNNIDNADFICDTAKEATNKLLQEKFRPDIVCVDPPRKGLDKDTIESCIKMSPQKIVYVSCNPATLARDLLIFKANNYHAQVANMIDMFPRTPHVETVVLLEKQN